MCHTTETLHGWHGHIPLDLLRGRPSDECGKWPSVLYVDDASIAQRVEDDKPIAVLVEQEVSCTFVSEALYALEQRDQRSRTDAMDC